MRKEREREIKMKREKKEYRKNKETGVKRKRQKLIHTDRQTDGRTNGRTDTYEYMFLLMTRTYYFNSW